MRWTKTGAGGKRTVEMNTKAGEEVSTYMRGERCRKAILEEYMDGVGRGERCQGGEAACDVCIEGTNEESEGAAAGFVRGERSEGKTAKRRLDVIEAQESRLAKRARGGGWDRWESTARLARGLQKYAGRCAICVRAGRSESGEHEWWDCERLGEEGMEEMERVWEELGGIEWERYSSCEGCRIPQGVCRRWRDVDNRERAIYEEVEGEDCQFRGVMRAGLAAMLVLGEGEGVSWMEERMRERGWAKGVQEGGESGWWEGARRVLGLRVEMEGGWQGSVASQMFERFCGE